MRNHRQASLVTLAFCAMQLLAGCDNEPQKNPNVPTSSGISGEGGAGGTGGIGGGKTGAHFNLQPGDEVASGEFTIKRVSCDGEPIDPLTITHSAPVGNAGNGPLVDYFQLLEPGCYDVVVQPIDANGSPSTKCSAAYYDNMVIVDGTTTEIGLVSQCVGELMGAADIWWVLNRPPVISGVTFDPDKWTPYCSQQKICVEFTDKDGDPVEIEWHQRSGAPLASGPTPLPSQFDPATGKTTQCATLVHSVPGTVALEVIAFDLMQAPGGGLMRIEQFYKNLGLPYESHDSLSFPSHGISTPSCPCAPSAEICDIIDNDCDGQNNEALTCACLPFETKYCYGGPPGTAGKGVCRSGGRTCKFDGSAFNSQCVGAVLPSTEQCNGLDDDCDGQVDEGLNCVPCTPPAMQACVYTGPSGTQNVGECRAGMQVCSSSNQWSSCIGEVLPVTEIVGNGKDDDCDGQVDEGGGTEICNGLDDNQNGQIDEGLGSSSCGVGACAVTVQNCVNGQTQTCAPLAPKTEVCNGIDDNCNGQTDEQLGATSCGVGACQNTVQNCVNGQAQTCTPLPAGASEICNNGIDDNCNGQTDENCICGNGSVQPCYSGASATKNVGVCHDGTQLCQGGVWGACTGEVLPSATETCGDNLDNNCDGQVDENPPCIQQPLLDACLASCIGGTQDGVCAAGENSFNCAQDCACGDGICSGSETPESCHVDCKFSSDLNGMCGNGHCDPWEFDASIPAIYCKPDCWDGVVLAGAICGNGTCSPQENATNCAADCGNAKAYVNGNGVCDPGEHWSTSVDCVKNIDAGTFLKAECQGYSMVETYADGNGGTTSHTVTTCSESCGAAPWKMLTPNWSQSGFNGVQVLRPDCTVCTMTNPPIANIVGDTVYGYQWVSVYNQLTYEMDMDPNKCNLAAYPYNPGTPFSSYILPLEWEKVGEKNCSPQAPCDVRDCTGNHYPQSSGVVGTWKPAYGSWSMYEAYCQ